MSGRPFYGWVVLAAAFVIITMAIGTLFTLGVFLKPIEDSMGWSRSGIGAIGLFNWFVMGLGGLVSGFVADRLGTRRVVLVGALVLGAGLLLSSHVQQMWHFYVTFGLLVGAGVSAFYVPLTVLAIRWFEGRRAMAAAVVSAGNGLGILALAPLTRWLITEFDWRVAFLVLGNLALVLVLPAAWLLREPGVREQGRHAGRPPLGERGGPHCEPQPQARRADTKSWAPAADRRPWGTWPFWAIALTHFCCCAAHSGPLFHLVSHAIDQGVPRMVAAGMLGASGLTSILGRVGTGIVADRFGAKRTLVIGLALQAALVFLYLFAEGAGALYAVSLAFGISYGGAMPLYPVVTREYFGERVLGTAYGAIFFISCIGMGLGSYAGGAIHDLFGSYQWLFIASFAIGTMAVVLGVSLRPPLMAAAARPSPAPGG
jgi:MFS family permease